MAVTRADARQWNEPSFLGLSTDTKPTGDNVGANALFLELDTDTLYYYDGTQWVAVGNNA